MTNHPSEKRAEELYQALLRPETSLEFKDPTELIAQALREYAQEAVKEALAIGDTICSQHQEPCERCFAITKLKAREEGAEQMRERAANIAGDILGDSDMVVKEIRSLPLLPEGDK